MALSQIGPERRAIPEDKQAVVDDRSGRRIVSRWSVIALSKESARVPPRKVEKLPLIFKDRHRSPLSERGRPHVASAYNLLGRPAWGRRVGRFGGGAGAADRLRQGPGLVAEA